jgi:hypothetical protein
MLAAPGKGQDPGHSRYTRQSRCLHAAIAGHLVTGPDAVLGRARANLDRFSAVHAGTMAAYWLGLWRAAQDEGPGRVLGVLVSDRQEAAEMRQNSQFTGILPAGEHGDPVLESFRAHWQAGHVR